MSLQTQDVTPTCSDHGYMVPVGSELALLDNNDFVVAMVEWVTKPDGSLGGYIFALDEETLALVPRLGGETQVGNWAYEMMQSGQLVSYYHKVVPANPGVLRVIDARPGFKHGYRVFSGEPTTLDGPKLRAGALYYCFVDDDEVRKYPPLRKFDDVMALTNLPEAVKITDACGLSGTLYSDPEAIAAFGDLTSAIRVEDESSIHSHNMGRKA